MKPIEQFRHLRILILEDVPTDADLMRRELVNAGYDIQSVVVENESSFISGLQNFKPDLILADYILPEFSGFEALNIAHHYQPDIPFVFITGAISEEIATETIIAGAAGFVMKAKLEKLPEVVKTIFSGNIKWYDQRLKRTRQRIDEIIKSNQKLLTEVHHFMETRIGIDRANIEEVKNNQKKYNNQEEDTTDGNHETHRS